MGENWEEGLDDAFESLLEDLEREKASVLEQCQLDKPETKSTRTKQANKKGKRARRTIKKENEISNEKENNLTRKRTSSFVEAPKRKRVLKAHNGVASPGTDNVQVLERDVSKKRASREKKQVKVEDESEKDQEKGKLVKKWNREFRLRASEFMGYLAEKREMRVKKSIAEAKAMQRSLSTMRDTSSGEEETQGSHLSKQEDHVEREEGKEDEEEREEEDMIELDEIPSGYSLGETAKGKGTSEVFRSLVQSDMFSKDFQNSLYPSEPDRTSWVVI